MLAKSKHFLPPETPATIKSFGIKQTQNRSFTHNINSNNIHTKGIYLRTQIDINSHKYLLGGINTFQEVFMTILGN